MKKLVLITIVVLFAFLVGCSTVPTMTYGKSSASYEKITKERKNILLSFEDYEDYEVWVYSKDISILDFKILGIPFYKRLNVFMVKDKPVLLENLRQGIKVIYVQLIPKVDTVSRTTNKYALKEIGQRRKGKIVLNIGIEDNTIQITDPKNIKVQQIVNIGVGVFLEVPNKKRNVPKW